jgi:hypothetical protein
LNGQLLHHITLGTLQFSGRHYPKLAVNEKLKEMRNGGCLKYGDDYGPVEVQVLLLITTI